MVYTYDLNRFKIENIIGVTDFFSRTHLKFKLRQNRSDDKQCGLR